MRVHAIDISGGMAGQPITLVRQAIRTMTRLEYFDSNEIAILFDNRVQLVTTLGDFLTDRDRMGGGTLLAPVGEWLQANASKDTHVYLYSDGGLNDTFGFEPEKTVLFCNDSSACRLFYDFPKVGQQFFDSIVWLGERKLVPLTRIPAYQNKAPLFDEYFNTLYALAA